MCLSHRNKHRKDHVLSYARVQPSTVRVRRIPESTHQYRCAVVKLGLLLVRGDVVEPNRLDIQGIMSERRRDKIHFDARTVSQEETNN